MREELRNILKLHRFRLVNELGVTTTFLASLTSNDVISDEDKALVEWEKTPHAKVDKLIEILGTKADMMFQPFCDAIKVVNSDLYDLLTRVPGKTVAPNQTSYCVRTEKSQLSGKVKGITSLNEELYIVVDKSAGIDVYDVNTLEYRRKIPVAGLVNAYSMVAHANVLYVSEFKAELIHRIQLSDGTSSHWAVNGEELSMPINNEGNVVVSSWTLNKILEYTPAGSYVREIKVDAIDGTIRGLQHVIQLDDDRFLICQASKTHHRVCMIDSKGRMMKSFGGDVGSGERKLDYPSCLAIQRNGIILVADKKNDRIIRLNASLEFVEEFIPGSAGLKKPRRMHLDEIKNRLYVSGERNMTVFDL